MSDLPQLPPGLSARHLRAADVVALADLICRVQERTWGHAGADVEAVRSTAVGIGSWTRHQCLVSRTSGSGTSSDQVAPLAWASAHDRAAGRTDLVLHVDRTPNDAEAIAIALLDWLDATAASIARSRDLTSTLLEILVDAGDMEMQRWLTSHGHHRARRWLNMSRPVAPGEQLDGREGVTVRRVRTHDLGDGTTMPVAEDLQAVHRVLERSFVDHFNSYRESFGEFVQRLREDSGHRWDHWWLATVEHEGRDLAAGALVSTVSPADASGVEGSYVSYIGVDRLARGRGVAKALLATVINDAAERGRNRVGLEVDADSPTGADGLYTSLGWQTTYVTESWQKQLTVA